MKSFIQYISEMPEGYNLSGKEKKSIKQFCAGKGPDCLRLGGKKVATRVQTGKPGSRPSHHQKWHFQLHPGGQEAKAAHPEVRNTLKHLIRQKARGHAFSKQAGRGKFPAVNQSWSLVNLPTKTNEELSMDDFVSFAGSHLDLKDKPKITFVQEKEPDMTSACYKPSNKSMTIASKGRRFMDIARSVAHEMVHQQQHEKLGDPSKIDGSTGSPHEDEANAVAGRILRMYGKEKPELYTEAFEPSRKKKLANRQTLRKSTERRVDLIRRNKYNDPEITSKYSFPTWRERLQLMGLKESLASEMDKSDDPYEFSAKMMRKQREGDMPLRKRGAASARELVAAWKKRKDRNKK